VRSMGSVRLRKVNLIFKELEDTQFFFDVWVPWMGIMVALAMLFDLRLCACYRRRRRRRLDTALSFGPFVAAKVGIQDCLNET
jgi:hypothetical protein